MFTKRHTTPALIGADRQKASRASLSLPATHMRALAPDQCCWRTKPRLQHAHSRITSSLYCHMLRLESFSRGGPVTDTNVPGWWDDRPNTSGLGSTYATKKTAMVVACFSAKIFVRIHARVLPCRRNQIDEMTREGTAQSVTVPCNSSQNGGKLALQSWTRSKFQIARSVVHRARVRT